MPYDYDKAYDAVMSALRQVYYIRRKRRKIKTVKWNGPKIPEMLAGTSIDFQERLSAFQLDYAINDEGQQPLEIILSIVSNIGAEAGRELLERRLDEDIGRMNLNMRFLKEAVEREEDMARLKKCISYLEDDIRLLKRRTERGF